MQYTQLGRELSRVYLCVERICDSYHLATALLFGIAEQVNADLETCVV
jgi:hypothetical protein